MMLEHSARERFHLGKERRCPPQRMKPHRSGLNTTAYRAVSHWVTILIHRRATVREGNPVTGWGNRIADPAHARRWSERVCRWNIIAL